MPINYTYKKNLKRNGSTVKGRPMFDVVDNSGNPVSNQLRGLDYELGTFYIDWINERNTKPNGVSEALEVIKQREGLI